MTSPFCLIQFEGDKTLQALQGQCTQAVTGLTDADALLVAFCDQKAECMAQVDFSTIKE